jgi:hypothetical protein
MKRNLRINLTVMTVAALAVPAVLTASAQTPAPGGATTYAQEAVGAPAELTKGMDSKNAKVGDGIEARIAANVRLADGTELPRGTRLTGHVTDVGAKSKDNHDGHIAFTFDHAVLKDGKQIAIHVWMQSISVPAPVTNPGGSDAMLNGNGMAGGGQAGGAMGGARAGAPSGDMTGGSGGMGPGGNRAGNMSAGAGPVNATAGSTAGPSSTLAPSGPVGNLPGSMFSTVSAVQGTAGGADASSPAPAGVSAATPTATMVTVRGKNVSLDNGSQMMLAVMPQS